MWACSKNESSRNGSGAATPEDQEEVGSNFSPTNSDSVSTPDIVSGSYLVSNVQRSSNNKATISASIYKNSVRIAKDLEKMGITLQWILRIDDKIFQDSPGMALLPRDAGQDDKSWVVDLSIYTTTPTINIVAYVSGKVGNEVIPVFESPTSIEARASAIVITGTGGQPPPSGTNPTATQLIAYRPNVRLAGNFLDTIVPDDVCAMDSAASSIISPAQGITQKRAMYGTPSVVMTRLMAHGVPLGLQVINTRNQVIAASFLTLFNQVAMGKSFLAGAAMFDARGSFDSTNSDTWTGVPYLATGPAQDCLSWTTADPTELGYFGASDKIAIDPANSANIIASSRLLSCKQTAAIYCLAW